jgi:hypothetical protein
MVARAKHAESTAVRKYWRIEGDSVVEKGRTVWTAMPEGAAASLAIITRRDCRGRPMPSRKARLLTKSVMFDYEQGSERGTAMAHRGLQMDEWCGGGWEKDGEWAC